MQVVISMRLDEMNTMVPKEFAFFLSLLFAKKNDPGGKLIWKSQDITDRSQIGFHSTQNIATDRFILVLKFCLRGEMAWGSQPHVRPRIGKQRTYRGEKWESLKTFSQQDSLRVWCWGKHFELSKSINYHKNSDLLKIKCLRTLQPSTKKRINK